MRSCAFCFALENSYRTRKRTIRKGNNKNLLDNFEFYASFLKNGSNSTNAQCTRLSSLSTVAKGTVEQARAEPVAPPRRPTLMRKPSDPLLLDFIRMLEKPPERIIARLKTQAPEKKVEFTEEGLVKAATAEGLHELLMSGEYAKRGKEKYINSSGPVKMGSKEL